MNAYTITFIVLGFYLVAVALVLVTRRLITRSDPFRRWAAHFGRHGLSITNLSREILGRTMPATTEEHLVAVDGKNESKGISHFQLVGNASETNEATGSAESSQTLPRFPSVPARQPGVLFRHPAEDSSHPSMLTAADHRELSAAIVAARKLAAHQRGTQLLQKKLAHAVISPAGRVPPDLITMYSRAELLDLETEERLSLILVFPIDANLDRGRISVFHPLGAALLGRRVGDRLDWTVPYGVRRFEVRAVHFQPETALAQAA